MSIETSTTAPTGGVRTETMADGQILRLALATPKANILDGAKIEALTREFRAARENANIKVIVIEGEGDHFSFGASVPEHLPGNFETMIPAFHNMFRAMMDSSIVTIAAVRGQCLGGGLELAAFCHRIIAAPGAFLGQPEIVLGVFAPVASLLLPERLGRGRGEDLCLTGRMVAAEEALAIGLVDEIREDPSAAAVEWAQKRILPRSASSLRFAVRAARVGWEERFRNALDEVERLYMHELMSTQDAVEGLQSFLEKRDPIWRNE